MTARAPPRPHATGSPRGRGLLAPHPPSGWFEFDIVRPTCECAWHKNLVAAQTLGVSRPVWCVHTAALMVELAWQVESDPLLLALLNGFELEVEKQRALRNRAEAAAAIAERWDSGSSSDIDSGALKLRRTIPHQSLHQWFTMGPRQN